MKQWHNFSYKIQSILSLAFFRSFQLSINNIFVIWVLIRCEILYSCPKLVNSKFAFRTFLYNLKKNSGAEFQQSFWNNRPLNNNWTTIIAIPIFFPIIWWDYEFFGLSLEQSLSRIPNFWQKIHNQRQILLPSDRFLRN